VGEYEIKAKFKIENMLAVSVNFKFSDVPEFNPEQEGVDEILEYYKPNDKLFSSTLLYKIMINLAECTFTANIIRDFSFLLTKRLFSLLLSTIFNQDDP
jgi:hypothetical protein